MTRAEGLRNLLVTAVVVLAAPLAMTAFAVTGVPVGDAIDAIELEPLGPDETAGVGDVASGWGDAPAAYPASTSPFAAELGEARLAGSAQPSPGRRAEPDHPGETAARTPARPAVELSVGAPPAVSTAETAVGEPAPEDPAPTAPSDTVSDPVPPPPELTP